MKLKDYTFQCNKCHRDIKRIELNNLEVEELKQEGSFVCSTCINDEMDEELKDFIISKNEIEPYGDDLRAVIRAFADKITPEASLKNKNNLVWLANEIKFILAYEVLE